MDDDVLISKVSELHRLWWETVWGELAWDEHGCEPASFALTIGAGWDRFGRMAKALEGAGIDMGALVAEFEAAGDPRCATRDDHAAMLGRARCGS